MPFYKAACVRELQQLTETYLTSLLKEADVYKAPYFDTAKPITEQLFEMTDHPNSMEVLYKPLLKELEKDNVRYGKIICLFGVCSDLRKMGDHRELDEAAAMRVILNKPILLSGEFEPVSKLIKNAKVSTREEIISLERNRCTRNATNLLSSFASIFSSSVSPESFHTSNGRKFCEEYKRIIDKYDHRNTNTQTYTGMDGAM